MLRTAKNAIKFTGVYITYTRIGTLLLFFVLSLFIIITFLIVFNYISYEMHPSVALLYMDTEFVVLDLDMSFCFSGLKG